MNRRIQHRVLEDTELGSSLGLGVLPISALRTLALPDLTQLYPSTEYGRKMEPQSGIFSCRQFSCLPSGRIPLTIYSLVILFFPCAAMGLPECLRRKTKLFRIVVPMDTDLKALRKDPGSPRGGGARPFPQKTCFYQCPPAVLAPVAAGLWFPFCS